MTLFPKLFPSGKPLIAMAHLPPTLGTPLYDPERGMAGLVDAVRRDLETLTAAGFDAVLFCNEGDRPYVFQAGYAGVASLTRVVTELAPSAIPFGVDFLWDPQAALSVAAATGASFIREVTTGVYDSDMGLWNTHPGALLRERSRLHADDVAVFMNITPEFASPMGNRTVGQVARSVAVSCIPDAILVSGPMAGAAPDLSAIEEAKEAVGERVPVLANTGVKAENVARFLEVADGVIVGSDLKVDGYTWNPVDPDRARRFVEAAKG